MNKVVTENIGKAREITLLGGRLYLKNGSLILGDKDYLREETSYYYFPSPSSHDDFIKSLRKKYVSKGEVQVFDGASINYELKYIPLLKCEDKLLALNNEDDYYITDSFFETPLTWDNAWDSMMAPVTNGCLRSVENSLLPINLSYKEISYLVPRLGLSLPNQLQVVLMPFHKVCITNEQHEYHVVQIALENTWQISDYPLFDDSTFSAMSHVLFLIAFYGVAVAFILDNVDQARPFIESYAGWWKNHLSIPNIRETFNDYIPILGWLAGMVVELIIGIVFIILIATILPALALVSPAIAASILASCTKWIRRLYIRIKRVMLFNRACT